MCGGGGGGGGGGGDFGEGCSLNGQKKYAEAAELMAAGAFQLLAAGQVNSGAELANLLLDTYTKAGTPAGSAQIGM